MRAHVRATSCLSVTTRAIASPLLLSSVSSSAYGTNFAEAHALESKGMYSMKRTSIGREWVRRANAGTCADDGGGAEVVAGRQVVSATRLQ